MFTLLWKCSLVSVSVLWARLYFSSIQYALYGKGQAIIFIFALLFLSSILFFSSPNLSGRNSICPQNILNFSLLTAEICWRVWGTPANFNGFRVLASLLQRRRSTEANQTLRDVWPFPGLVRYVYILGAVAPWRNFARCKIHFTSKSCVLLYWQRYCTALQQRALAKLCGMVRGMELRNFRWGRHLYSAGRPSRWASAYFLVAQVNNVLCTFCKQKMIVLADSEVSDVKVTWWFWNKWRRTDLYVQTSAIEAEGTLKRLQLRLWVTAI